MRSFNFPERDYMFRIHNTTIFAGSQAIYLKKAQGEFKNFNYDIFNPMFDFVTFNNALSAILYDNSNISPCISIRLLPACIFLPEFMCAFSLKKLQACPPRFSNRERQACVLFS